MGEKRSTVPKAGRPSAPEGARQRLRRAAAHATETCARVRVSGGPGARAVRAARRARARWRRARAGFVPNAERSYAFACAEQGSGCPLWARAEHSRAGCAARSRAGMWRARAYLGEAVEEGAARAGGEPGEGRAQRVVAGLQPGPVRRVRRVQPSPVAEEPFP